MFMSFSGKMAYRGLRWMTTLFPSMKEDFTDIDTELEKPEESIKRINMFFRRIKSHGIKR